MKLKTSAFLLLAFLSIKCFSNPKDDFLSKYFITQDFKPASSETIEKVISGSYLSQNPLINTSISSLQPPVNYLLAKGSLLNQLRKKENFELCFFLGYCYSNLNNIDSAIFFYDKAIILNPKNTDALVEIANLHYSKNQLLISEQKLKKALAIKKSASALHNLALVHFKRKEYEKSLKLLEQVPKVDPHFTTYDFKVSCLYFNGNYLDAANLAKYAGSSNSNNNYYNKSYNNYYLKSAAYCFYKAKDIKASRQIFNQIFKSHRDFTSSYFKGCLETNLNNFTVAFEDFKAAADFPSENKLINPNYYFEKHFREDLLKTSSYLKSASESNQKSAKKTFCLLYARQFSECDLEIDRWLKVDPTSDVAKEFKILTLRFQEKPSSEILNRYNQLLNSFPSDYKLLLNKAAYEQSILEYIMSLEDFSKCIKLGPNFASAIYKKGLLNQEIGNHEEAIKDFDKCISIDSMVNESMLQKSISLYWQGNNKESIIILNALLNREKDKSEIDFYLGLNFIEIGKLNNAYEKLLKNYKEYPSNSSNQLCLGWLCNIIGKEKEGSEYLRLASHNYFKDTTNAYYLGEMGWIKFLQHDYNQSLFYSKKAVNLDSTLRFSRFNIPLAYLANGELDKAKNAYSQEIKYFKQIGVKVFNNEVLDLRNMIRENIEVENAKLILRDFFNISL